MRNSKEDIMDLLKQGLLTGAVIKTDRATKMVVDGLTDTYPIYQVRLDHLFFNDQNDRIATWISQYKADNGADSLNRNDVERYNAVIQSFITQSNPDRLKQTEMNIEMIGQQEHGVVLADGRIINGNRRFSCLRNLSKKRLYCVGSMFVISKQYATTDPTQLPRPGLTGISCVLA